MNIVMHSYTFRDYSLEHAFQNALRFGYQAIELQPCHFNRDNVAHDVAQAMALSKTYGVPIYCFDFSGSFFDDDSKAIEASLAQFITEIDVCADHGITVMNGFAGWLVADKSDFGKNGSTLAKPVHYERAAEALRTAARHAKTCGIRIMLEVHMNTIHDTFASTAKLLDMIGEDNVLANPDPGNMFATSTAEKDPAAMDQLSGRIGYFHLKNCLGLNGTYSYSVKLADGHIDIYKWIDTLMARGYRDPICIEFCGAGDPHVAAQQDIGYLRQCLAIANRA